MLTFLMNLVRGEEGATMVEYGIMLAFIALVCVGAVAVIGPRLSDRFAGVRPALR